MYILTLSIQGQQIFDQLRTDPNYSVTIDRVVFSNLYQPTGDTILGDNTMYGSVNNGFILLSYNMLFSNEPTKTIIIYVDRVLYNGPDWIPRSFGLYTSNNLLLCYGNVVPTDYEVGVLARVGLVFYGFQANVLDRVLVSSLYGSLNVNQLIRQNLVGRESDDSCAEERTLYNHFSFNNNLKLVSHGLKFRWGNNKYKLMLNETLSMLEGELI